MRLLAGGTNNVCVVGDDDQSIYKFRGATIENILNFEKVFTGAKTIRLEQNYRSTANILNAANSVIKNNMGRKGKTLWTDHGDGEKVHHYTATNEQDEASHIAGRHRRAFERGREPEGPRRALPHERSSPTPLKPTSPARASRTASWAASASLTARRSRTSTAIWPSSYNPRDDVRLRRIINEPAP